MCMGMGCVRVVVWVKRYEDYGERLDYAFNVRSHSGCWMGKVGLRVKHVRMTFMSDVGFCNLRVGEAVQENPRFSVVVHMVAHCGKSMWRMSKMY